MLELLQSASTVLITTHKDPDLDGVGSALAWYLQLKKMGKTCVIWVADGFEHAHYLSGLDAVVTEIPRGLTFDVLLVLDASTIDRVRGVDVLSKFPFSYNILNIDHHMDNTMFGNVNIVDKTASSVAEMTVTLFKESGWEIDKQTADNLYAGLCYDTGRFMHSNVTEKTFLTAAELLRCGADARRVTQAMYEDLSVSDLDVMKLTIDNMIVKKDIGYAYTVLPKEVRGQTKIKPIDVMRMLGGVKVVMVFQECANGEIKVNFRSKSGVNVQELASLFGGGGHYMAAGVTLAGRVQDVINKISKELEKALN
ncbi:bifunctional oligoribonuclease/PAP phosphatase NrnA [Thermoproteota archaeon]